MVAVEFFNDGDHAPAADLLKAIVARRSSAVCCCCPAASRQCVATDGAIPTIEQAVLDEGLDILCESIDAVAGWSAGPRLVGASAAMRRSSGWAWHPLRCHERGVVRRDGPVKQRSVRIPLQGALPGTQGLAQSGAVAIFSIRKSMRIRTFAVSTFDFG